MIQHVSKVTSTCCYHLRRLHQIRNYISRETMIQLAMSLVIYRIDYCNCVLVGLPASKLAPLQRVQNAAARLILGLSRRFKKIRIIFRVATTVHNIFLERSSSVDLSVVNCGHQQSGPPLSFEQELSSVDALFQSVDQTFGTISVLI